VAAADVVLPQHSAGGRYLAAYRQWLDLDPSPADHASAPRRGRPHKATANDIDLSGPIDLVALSVKENAARCQLLGSGRVLTLRASRLWKVVPAEIVVVRPRRQWSYAGHPYLSGEIESSRLEVAALGLVPLALEDQGIWNPEEEYWGEEGEPIDEWAKPIIARGPRQAFEMEQVLPGADPDDPDSDPIGESNDLKDAGEGRPAHAILMKLCEADLRCLDAHTHLGNFVFDHRPKEAIRHYEAGVRIGELSLSPAFEGCCPGATSTTVRSSAACTGSACVSGGSVDSKRRRASSTGCCGSTPRTTRACGVSSTRCVRASAGKTVETSDDGDDGSLASRSPST